MYHIHHHVNSHGTEYMEGTDLHRQHHSCLLGIPAQLGGMYGISSVLWVGTEVWRRGWWSEATGVGRVWKRCSPEGWGLRAWSRVVGSRRGEALLRARRPTLAGWVWRIWCVACPGEEVSGEAVGTNSEKAGLCSRAGAGNPSPWLASGVLSPETVLRMGCVCAGFCGDHHKG